MRRNLAVPGVAAVFGGLAALFALGNSRVPVGGLVLCPVLLAIWPVFDRFADWSDGWLWALTITANALTYALLARGGTAFLRRRSRRQKAS